MAGPLKSGKTKTTTTLSKKKIAVVVAEWNEEVTEALFEGAYSSLVDHGFAKKNIIRKNEDTYPRSA